MNNKEMLIEIAKETDEIVSNGSYMTPNGKKIEVKSGKPILYKPDFDYSGTKLESKFSTKIEVTNETTLGACRRLKEQKLACLNFASAKNPGGGYLTGSRAQEESIARSSTLAQGLRSKEEYYKFNRDRRSGLYSDYIIYSEDIMVFRDDSLMLLEEPYHTNVITSPAVNRNNLTQTELNQVNDVMMERIRKILYVAYINGDETLVLGAFGCGVFKNDPYVVANYFKTLLEGEFKGVFNQITFAIIGDNLTAFKNVWRM